MIKGESEAGVSIAGQQLAGPEVSAAFIGTYFYELSADTEISLQMSYTWQSETGTDEFMGGSDLVSQDSYGLLGAQVAVEGEAWSVSAYVDNIADEEYYEGGVVDTGYNHFGIGKGTNGGVKVKYNF